MQGMYSSTSDSRVLLDDWHSNIASDDFNPSIDRYWHHNDQ